MSALAVERAFQPVSHAVDRDHQPLLDLHQRLGGDVVARYFHAKIVVLLLHVVEPIGT